MTSDLALLQDYARNNIQASFTAVVNRHLDLVHSAALRQVRSPQLAEEVAQSVFTDLARNAGKLKPDTILTAWLYQVTRHTAIDVIRRESRRQLREQIVTEMNAMNATADDWTHIEPLLDDAMEALDETDRTAILLRFFENKPLREVGEQLGVSDDAAQKRVSRAVERLKDCFNKRKVRIGVSGFIALISANAVQSAPVGLAATISAATAVVSTTVATSVAAATTKAIAMTTLQKTVITATLAIVAGAGIYEARQASKLTDEVQALQQQQAPLTAQVQQLSEALIAATNQIAGLREENERLSRNTSELLKLRAQATALNTELRDMRAEIALNKRNQEAVAAVSTPAPTGLFFWIGGQVTSPGAQPWTQGLKLTDAVRMSGNLTDAADKRARVIRADGTSHEYDFRDILSGKSLDPLLGAGDKVQIPRLENWENVEPDTEFHVGGAVLLPSHWPWVAGLKLTDAISTAGGLTDNADGRVVVMRHTNGTGRIQNYNFPAIMSGRAENPVLEPGDHIQAQPLSPPTN